LLLLLPDTEVFVVVVETGSVVVGLVVVVVVVVVGVVVADESGVEVREAVANDSVPGVVGD
jgi:hypothetical protein